MQAEIEAADPNGPARTTKAAAVAIAAYLGDKLPVFPMRALVVEAVG